MDADADVLVVGMGPVGLLALTMMGRAGISALGIDRDPALWPQARAVHFDDEVLRIMQSIGLGESIGALCSPMRNYRFENEAGDSVVSHTFGLVGPQGWPVAMLFHQPDIDRVLREEAEAASSVELRSGTTLVDLDQDADAVTATVVNAAGERSSVRARWMIAADGATSTVRKLLDITTENLGTDEPWAVIDGVLRGPTPMPDDMVVLGRHSRPGLWLNLPNGRARLEMKVLPGDDLQHLVTPVGVAAASKGLLTPENFDCDRAAIYTFRSRLAARWRVGRVFLAGDAAHQAPPLFGQGLCAGIRDVANLAWKLRLVLAGVAPQTLLDSYETERVPHARYWVEQATAMAGFAQTTDPAVAAQRDGYLRAAPGGGVPPPPPIGPGVHTRGDDASGPAGLLAPQPVLADGRLLDTLVGWRFLVAVDPQLAAELDPALLRNLAADPYTVVLSAAEHVSELLTQLGARAAVVRPDRYVLGTADDPADFRTLLELLPTRTGTTLSISGAP